MTQYNTFIVKLSSTQPNKLKLEIKNGNQATINFH